MDFKLGHYRNLRIVVLETAMWYETVEPRGAFGVAS